MCGEGGYQYLGMDKYNYMNCDCTGEISNNLKNETLVEFHTKYRYINML